jgi:hypothetical protein
MSGSDLAVTRTTHRLRPDSRRVLAKPFLPGEEIVPCGPSRATLLMDRILDLPEPEVISALESVMTSFSSRHEGFEQILERHFERVVH